MKRILTLMAACAVTAGLVLGSASARTVRSSAATKYSAMDATFLQTSMQGDVFEIQGGKMAEQKSRNASVIKLARTLVADHTKSYNDARALARKLGIRVETTPTASEQWELKAVGSTRGASFNRWYSSLEVSDHIQDISETTAETKEGSNGSVVGTARSDLPVLRTHLHLAQAAVKASH